MLGTPPDAPRDRLMWVMLKDQRVFWPACVYDDYNTAVAHNHDLTTVRADKPSLDLEDRVVFFFGVRNVTGVAAQSTVVPNVRFCVVKERKITAHVWEGADDFGNVCRTHNVEAELIARVEQNSAFQRACGDATRFFEEAEEEDDAQRLFMEFLVGAKTRSGNAQPMRKVARPTSIRESSKVEKKVAFKAPEETAQKKVETTALTPELTALCWSLMEQGGWSTFVKPDGSKLYAMPGVQFFEFRPNETVFEALHDACIKFLQVWTQSQDDHTDNQSQLQECFWSMMVSSGWQTITSADQIVYVMPNTTFDRFIPNETIFQSKQAAISKFLSHLGVQESDTHDSDMEDSSEEEAEASQLSEMATSDADMSDAESDLNEQSESEGDEEVNDVDDDVEDIARSRRTVRDAQITKKRKEISSTPFRWRQERPEQVAPPFKLKQGLVEQELRSRGWYWKPVPTRRSADGFMFYKPHCKDKDESELRVGQDCFAGYLSVEAYIKDYEPTIIEKLRDDHEAAYARTHIPEQASRKVRKPAATGLQPRRIEVIELSDDDDEPIARSIMSRKPISAGSARRKLPQDKIKQYRAQPVSSHQIKFGDIWRKLEERGWFYRPGQFEYDYFRPTSKRKRDLVRGEDYFSSKTALEEYLKKSGLWREIAEEIKRADGEEEHAVEERASPVKRTHSVTEDAPSVRTPATKKAKVSTDERVEFFTPPPTDRAKKPSLSLQQNDEAATQDLAAMAESSSQISPESTSMKSRKDESTPEGPLLARNLNKVFTPSPTAEKPTKIKESLELHLTASELARQSIARLSLAHQPPVFTHRESESNKIVEFCRECFDGNRGGSLYLSGSPGCGKSALLRSLNDHIGQLHKESANAPDAIVPVHVNAMGMNDFGQLFCQVAESLTNKEFTDGDEAFEAIERATKTGLKRSKTLLLVLDEIDALGKTSMEAELCRLFELAHRQGHSFILVGIANQIDFTERHLASLRLQLPNIRPQVIVFKPYSFQTISDILTDRLGGPANASRIVNAHGVAFIARKVAAQSGDVRLALDICRRVLQQKLSESATSGVEDFGSPISLIDIVKTIKTVLEGKSKSNVSSLPRNLQMILFATTRLVAQANCIESTPTPSPTDDSSTTHKLYRVDDLYECYCDVSHDAGVFKPLTRGEFKLGLETLSSEGMIGGTELKKQLLKLLCTPSELLQTFKNDAYFSRLI